MRRTPIPDPSRRTRMVAATSRGYFASQRLEADLWPDHAEDRRGAVELLAGFADYDPALLTHAWLVEQLEKPEYDPALLRRALLGEAGSGPACREKEAPSGTVRSEVPAVTGGLPRRWP